VKVIQSIPEKILDADVRQCL